MIQLSAMTIDTLEYVKKLEAAGVDRMQAEAHAEALRASIEDELATKADIQRLEAGTKADIQRLEASTKADIQRLEASTKADTQRLEGRISEVKNELEAKLSELKAEMLKYMVAQTFVIVGVVFALMRLVR
jgi:hypothetical protein